MEAHLGPFAQPASDVRQVSPGDGRRPKAFKIGNLIADPGRPAWKDELLGVLDFEDPLGHHEGAFIVRLA